MISVVTPTHNKAALLRRTLESLDGQDLDPSGFEAVVVDDGSTDGTPEFLAGYRPAFHVEVATQKENRGRSAARNLGLSRARGDVIVFLDDDMELVPGFLRAHRDLHLRGPGKAGVGNVVNHPEVMKAPIDRYMSTRGAQKIKDSGPLPWKYFSSNNSSVRKEDLDAVGGFDENFVTYGFEDLELGWRLQKERGLEIVYVAGARSFHIEPHSLEDVLRKKTLCGKSSMPYFFKKHPEARRELGYERFDPPRVGDSLGLNLKRVFFRGLLSRPVYGLVKPLAGLSLGRLSDTIFDYLVQYHYLAGLRRSGAEESGR